MFIDFSPEKKSHIKTEIMKSLKTRNKSPVHYKYTWQGCANQNHLLAAGCSGQEAFAMSGQRLFFSRTRVTPRGSSAGCDARTHTPQGHSTATLQGTGRRATSVASACWSVSGRELPRKRIPAGRSLTALGAQGGTCTPPSGCRIELWATQQFLLWIFFFLTRLFNLSSWYGRIDFCLVWLQWHP